MALDALTAMKAYGATAKALSQSATDAKAAAGPDFGALVKSAVSEASAQLSTAETMSTRGALGQADLIDVVTAVNAAEITLETMVAVRDEVIRAYQEVMRMPI